VENDSTNLKSRQLVGSDHLNPQQPVEGPPSDDPTPVWLRKT